MTKLEQIEKAITALSPEEIRKFAGWFEEFQADLWDRQIERDVAAGRLDKLIDEARDDIKAGRAKPL